MTSSPDMVRARVVGRFTHHITVCVEGEHLQFPTLGVGEGGILPGTKIEHRFPCSCREVEEYIFLPQEIFKT